MAITAGLIGGIAQGVGGIVSSIFGNKAQRDANEANMQIAQMNNEWSERMLNKQITANQVQLRNEQAFAKEQAQAANEFTEKMWNQTNEYNSAKNQAARLREAGINPALAMGGANAGTATSASGALGATPSGNSIGLPSPSSVQVQPLNYSGYAQAIEGAIMTAASLNKSAAETDFIRTQSSALAAKTKAEISKMFQEERSLKYNTDYRELTESLNVSNLSEEYLGKLQERVNMEEQNKLLKQMTAAQALINQNLPDKLAMDIAVQASIRDLNNKSVESVAQDIVKKTLENNQIDYTKEQYERLKEATIDILEAQKVGAYVGAGSSAISALGSLGSWKRKPTQVYSPHNHYTNIYNP